MRPTLAGFLSLILSIFVAQFPSSGAGVVVSERVVFASDEVLAWNTWGAFTVSLLCDGTFEAKTDARSISWNVAFEALHASPSQVYSLERWNSGLYMRLDKVVYVWDLVEEATYIIPCDFENETTVPVKIDSGVVQLRTNESHRKLSSAEGAELANWMIDDPTGSEFRFYDQVRSDALLSLYSRDKDMLLQSRDLHGKLTAEESIDWSTIVYFVEGPVQAVAFHTGNRILFDSMHPPIESPLLMESEALIEDLVLQEGLSLVALRLSRDRVVVLKNGEIVFDRNEFRGKQCRILGQTKIVAFDNLGRSKGVLLIRHESPIEVTVMARKNRIPLVLDLRD